MEVKKMYSYPCNRALRLVGCETSRLPNFLESLLTDGGEVASLTRLPACRPIFLVLISIGG
jgi:hypothetical protein